MKFIKDLKPGDRMADIYLCKHKQSATTKNGKAYDSVILQDKTGTIDAKIWDPNSEGIDDFDALDYIDVFGEVTSFNGALQINVKRARKCQEGEYEPSNYLPVSSKDIEEMYKELIAIINSIQNKYLKQLLQSFFVQDTVFIEKFKKSSAAKSVHHGFVGGLLVWFPFLRQQDPLASGVFCLLVGEVGWSRGAGFLVGGAGACPLVGRARSCPFSGQNHVKGCV